MHKPPSGYHVECPERVEYIINLLKDKGYKLDPVFERPDTLDLIKSVHSASYVEEIRELCLNGINRPSPFDEDTYLSRDSFELFLFAQNCWINAIDDVLSQNEDGYNEFGAKKEQFSYAISRPPGHHAMKSSSMGFCVFNYAVAAANYALSRGIKKIAMIDFDVHHGNGIASLVNHNEAIRYCSLHQMNIFPNGLSSAKEWTGKLNNCLNIDIPTNSGLEHYNNVLDNSAIPFIKEFEPNLIIVSAGFDALSSDPMAGISLLPDDYKEITKKIASLNIPTVFGLEGGYNLVDTAIAVEKSIEALIEYENESKSD